MHKQNGFTLVELLITLAIISIIAAVAIPTYSAQVARAARADATAGLLGLASSLERRFTENVSYCDSGSVNPGTCGDNAVGDTGAPAFFSAQVPLNGGVATYNLTIEIVTNTTFTVRATRAGRMLGDECGDFELTQAGVRTIINETPPMTAQDCWR